MTKRSFSYPPLVVTSGEPAGIGCEITLKAWASGKKGFCFIEDPEYVYLTASSLGIDLTIEQIDDPSQFDPNSNKLQLIPISWKTKPKIGNPDTNNAAIVIYAIKKAAEWTKSGLASGMVTNPIQKSTLYQANFKYPGHTEFLASLFETLPGAPVMMLVSNHLRVVPATVHIPIKNVAKTISTQLLIEKCRIINDSLQNNFGIPEPRIAVCGLNPHAGEDANIGDEDKKIIAPSILQLQDEGFNVSGPHPADTLFYPEARKEFDIVLGMYHDQVLIPIKTIDFYASVNVTLGLQFIRTSPDHGTGLNIAGKGIARQDSMVAAIELAESMALCQAQINGK